MVFNVLIPLYPGFNTLDVNGPLDVICNYALRETGPAGPFKITTTALDTNTQAYEFITAKRDISFHEAICQIQAGEFDVLLMPGCGGGADDALLKKPDGQYGAEPQIIDVLRAFLAHDNLDGKPKWFVSICVGAMFAGAAGAFTDMDVTTHWAALGKLATVCKAYGTSPKSITRQRWIDAGTRGPEGNSKVHTHILSSGGISCGLDASLYLVEQLISREAALSVGVMMDYAWRNV